jgi:hypothetical protein
MVLNGIQDLTFSGRQAEEFILEPAYNRVDISAIMTIHTGIKAKMTVNYAGQMRKVTKKNTGCGSGPSGAKIPVSQATWDPQELEMWVAQCYKDLTQTFLAWGLAAGYNRADLSQAVVTITDEQGNTKEVNLWTEFTLSKMQEAAADDFLRIVWFSDLAVTQGQLSSTADVSDYNQANGFFKRIFAAAAVTRKVSIQANQGTTYAAQQLPVGASLEILRGIVNNADARLTAAQNQVILVTQTIYSNWIDYRESLGLETSFGFQLNGDGTRGQILQSTTQYRGIPVIPINAWDRTIQEDYNNGTRLDIPHRAILTTIDNLAAGMDAPEGVSEFETWYERKDKEMNMRGNYMLDTQLVHPYLVSAAF